jgi:arylamine N-acetyltransferase
MRSMNRMRKRRAAMFAICLDNSGYDFSPQMCKVYRILPDPIANKHRLVRVIDDTGKDYLYGSGMFAPIRLSPKARAAFPQLSS